MKPLPPQSPSLDQSVKALPLKLHGVLKDFELGELCYVIAGRFQGKGPVKLILHRAQAMGPNQFGYGAFGYWVVSPGTLMGACRSEAKASASRANGKKGGRPKSIRPE